MTSKVSLFDFSCVGEDPSELPCYREMEENGSWGCVNDHTGCLFNDGHNECTHCGDCQSPLEEESREKTTNR